MNKEQAIGWVTANLQAWPKSARGPEAPQGWTWVIRRLPYLRPEIILQSNYKHDGEYIDVEQKETDLK